MIRGVLAMGLACAAAGWGTATVAPARGAEALTVRVGLVVDRPSVRLGADGPVTAVDASRGTALTLGGDSWTATPDPSGLAIGAVGFGPVVRLSPDTGFLRVDGRPYRGVIELRRTGDGRLTAIDEVDIEAYLYGVIKGEIDPRWPRDAVMAQAIAARTLAVERLMASRGRPSPEGYDLPATTDAQLYLGAAAEDPGAAAAVDATRGLVVTYEGRPIFAAYHSDSGGHTEDSENVWGTVYPYLRGVPDPYVVGSLGEEWTARVRRETLEAVLRRGGIDSASLREVQPGRVTPWGRAITVRLVTEDGRVQELNANRFRLLIGAGLIRSTMFTTVRAGEEVVFRGRGSGHGVGLDQWGARAMALEGFTFEQILHYYYTGVAIEQRF
jgi:stage II sporulation protein D